MNYRLIENDCLAALKAAGDEKIHAIVTDPPYGLSKEPDIAEVLKHWLAGDDYHHRGGGFMGKEWDSFVPGPAVWREAFRVLKPGGHLLAFAAPRTVDLMAISLRLAGFEIRDQIQWLYGQGFPKSHNIGMAIERKQFAEWLDTQPECRDYLKALPKGSDEFKAYEAELRKAAGLLRERVESEGGIPSGSHQLVDTGNQNERATTKNARGALNDVSAAWEDYGTALKPAQEPIIVARKPLGYIDRITPSGRPGKKRMTVADNVLAHGVGGYNIAATRIPTDESLSGGAFSDGGRGDGSMSEGSTGMFEVGKGRMPGEFVQPEGRHPANVIVDEVAAELLDEQAGAKVSRFFYTPKAGRKERDAGLEEFSAAFAPTMGSGIGGREHNPEAPGALVKNTHTTVKPIALMEWLIDLVTIEGQVVLDPFMGSGTTGIAAVRKGRNFVGIELEPEYVQIARARMAHWCPEDLGTYVAPPVDTTLADVAREAAIETTELIERIEQVVA